MVSASPVCVGISLFIALPCIRTQSEGRSRPRSQLETVYVKGLNTGEG